MKNFLFIWACLFLCIMTGCAAFQKSGSPAPENRWPEISQSENQYYYYTAAQFQKQKGDIDNAIFYMKMAIQKDPESSFLKKELAYLYMNQNSYGEALALIEGILEKDPEDLEALIFIGNMRMYLQEKDKAKIIYEKVLSLEPKNKNIYLFLGSIFLEEGEYEKALEVYKKMVKNFPESYTGYFFMGKTQAALNNFTDAEKEFRKALEIEPMLLEPRFELLKIYKERNKRESNTEKIIQLYEEILATYPNDTRASMELGIFYTQKGDLKKAEKIFNELAERSLTDRDIPGKIIFLFIDQKKYDEAIIILKGILKKIPESTDMNYLAGAAYDGAGNYTMALNHLKKVKEDSKFFESATIYIAYIYKNLNKPYEAIEHLKSAIEKLPENPEFFFHLGYCYEELEDFQHAEKALEKGIEKSPENSKLLFRLGVVYDKWGKKNQSIEKMKKVIQIDPNDAHALNYLGYTFLELDQNLDEAERLIRKAVELEPKDGYITDSLGWLFYKKGRFQEALATLEKAISYVPDDPIILEHLGDVYLKMNNHLKALEFYKRALSGKKKDTQTLMKKIKNVSSKDEL